MSDTVTMVHEPAARPVSGLVRASLTLIAGGAFSQLLPLLLGPLLTRMYTPADMGQYHLFAALAANLGVVACARYEFALPLAVEDDEAELLRVLCLRILAGAVLASVIGAIAWRMLGGDSWIVWLPLAVASAGAVSLATMWAMRLQRFSALAASRVWRYGGAAVFQVIAGWLGTGITGLMLGPIVAAFFATAMLKMPWGWQASRAALKGVAWRHRDFPILNTPHAFTGALQDTMALALVASTLGPAAAGFWGLGLRYLKAPATLIGGAVSQALYPKLSATGSNPTEATLRSLRRVILTLTMIAAPLVIGLWVLGPWLFQSVFGPPWREAGELARALALYIGMHFIAAPFAVVTMAWKAQAWALQLALLGQFGFIAALAAGLHWGGLVGAGWTVSAAMTVYFGYYIVRLATWPTAAATK